MADSQRAVGRGASDAVCAGRVPHSSQVPLLSPPSATDASSYIITAAELSGGACRAPVHHVSRGSRGVRGILTSHSTQQLCGRCPHRAVWLRGACAGRGLRGAPFYTHIITTCILRDTDFRRDEACAGRARRAARGPVGETAPLAHPSSRGASGRRIGVAPEPRRTIRPQRSAHSRAHPAFPARKNSRHNAGRHSRSTPQGQRRRAPHGTCRPACRCGGPTAAAHGAPRAQSRHAQPHVLYGSESEPRRAVSMYVGAWGSRVAGSAAPERGRSLRGVGPDVPAQHIHCHASPFAEHARPTAPQHPPQPSAGAVTADSSAAVREQEEGRATAPSRARGTHAERCALRLVSHERTRCAATE